MTGLVFLIERTAIGLYILLGVGIIWHVRQWLLARFAYRATSFELERDLARYQRNNAFTAAILLLEASLIVAGIQQVVAPTMRDDLLVRGNVVEENTADDGVFVTPTRVAPSGELPQSVDPSGIDLDPNDNAALVFATPTLTPTPVGTILPNAPATIGCNTPNATLQIPANGMRVFQPIPVTGTAFGENFSKYRIEIARAGGQFAVHDTQILPVNELATLSQFNPVNYEPGTYWFQLMVFDATDTLTASCRVTIYISDPIPTPTPIGDPN